MGITLSATAGSTLGGAKLSVDNVIVTYVDGSVDMLRFDRGSRAVLTVATDVRSTKVTSAIDLADGSSPVKVHGALKVVGSQIQDQYGKPVQLKGMSLYWSQWSPGFWNPALVWHQARTWNASIIRAAMAIEDNKGGYLADPGQRVLLETVVESALANGIYVIIDWHYTDAEMYTEEAKKFFREMAIQYGAKPNVIFEIFNEPLMSNEWPELKKYSEAVTAVIRAAGSQNLVLIPSPAWDQRVDMPANDPLNPATYGNVAYTLHFYAGSHGGSLRETADIAMKQGIPIFVSEWGASDATGGSNHRLYLDEARAWLDWMDDHHISSCNWSMCNKDESASALAPNASNTGPWPQGTLTESGAFVKSYITGTLPPRVTKAP